MSHAKALVFLFVLSIFLSGATCMSSSFEEGTIPAVQGRNRLAGEKSLYLRLHAGNPVHWFPWGDEAFEEARRRDKPVFLSVGYSTCHWCHVMARESFEDPEVASLLNETFVSIKVDREERPDVDAVFMEAAHLITGSGGWPLTVLLTPDRKPFFAGTYFPKESRPGRIGVMDLARRVAELWVTDRGKLAGDADTLVRSIAAGQERAAGGEIGEPEMKLAFEQLRRMHDPVNGGFGSGRKFPSPHQLLFLLRWWSKTKDERALRMVLSTLDAMAAGGIRDHIGGGFHRYATDEFWLLPHFEKMLYDQALIAAAFIEAFLATGREDFREVALEIFEYSLRDMLLPDGGFAAAEDAESEEEEGKFYVWGFQEMLDVLGPEDGPLAIDVFGADPKGNFADEASGKRTGANVLNRKRADLSPAKRLGMEEGEFAGRLADVKSKLLKARNLRIRPRRDDKVLADWNGLMISALAKGFQAFGEPHLLEAANRAADFVLGSMRDNAGKLLHRWAGGQAAIPGFLDDYAFMALGLLDLYEAGFEPKRLESAISIAREMIARFEAPGGGFFSTASDSPGPLLRRMDAYDGATPSGNSVAMIALARISRMTGDASFEECSRMTGAAFSTEIRRGAAAFTQMMCAADFLAGPPSEIVLVGGEGIEGMLGEIRRRFLPRSVLLFKSAASKEALALIAPFTKDMAGEGGRAAAYVCHDFACARPVSEATGLAAILGRPREPALPARREALKESAPRSHQGREPSAQRSGSLPRPPNADPELKD